MKIKTTLLVSGLMVLAWVFNSCGSKKPTNQEKTDLVSFYEVPLVCGAAPDIGCGSKSKPILLGLEKDNNIVREAWLNRKGTIIAIVWQDNTTPQSQTKTAVAVFKENNMDAVMLSGDEYNKMLSEFTQRKNWYRGNDVDKLSIEEAGIISERLITRINEKTPIAKNISDSLKKEFTDVFIRCFTKKYTPEINATPEKKYSEYKVQQTTDLLNVGKKYLNEEQMVELKKAIEMGVSPTENEKSCSDKNESKKDCCKKK